MATSVSSAVCGLSSLTLSSSSSCAPTPSASVSLKSAFSVSLPKCFHVATSVQHRKKPLLFAPRSSISVLKDDVEESPDEIRRGYESLYGPAFSKLQTRSDDQGFGEKRRQARERSTKDGMEEKVVQIRRVTKVVKGGKQLSFRAIVVVGDKKGRVGVGVGKAKEVITAVQKSAADARRHAVVVPMTKQKTFPHRADGKYGAAKVMLRPAAIGTGVIAGGSVRVVLELAGVINALGKELGSKNPLNNARATIEAISSMMQFRDVAEKRGIPMEELWK